VRCAILRISWTVRFYTEFGGEIVVVGLLAGLEEVCAQYEPFC
jgi:hypothetical protein